MSSKGALLELRNVTKEYEALPRPAPVLKGVDLRIIQQILGHANPQTTMIYTQLTEPSLKPATKIINQLMDNL